MMQYRQAEIFDDPQGGDAESKQHGIGPLAPPSFSVPYNKGVENQAILSDNRLHFEGQAKYVLDQLIKGRTITGVMAMQEFYIQDLRARIYSLKKAGLQISKGKVEGGHGAKTFFCTPEQIRFNKEKLGC